MVEQATNLIFQMKNNIQNTELIIDLLNNLESIICESLMVIFLLSQENFIIMIGKILITYY